MASNTDWSANEVSRMRPATPDNTRRLQDRARRMGASEAAIAKATKGYKKGGSVGSASKRADGCAAKGKTRGKFV